MKITTAQFNELKQQTDVAAILKAVGAEVERLTAEVNALSADRFDDQKAHENRLDQWRLDNEN